MSKKKRFGISEALTRGLSETIHVVENNAGIFRNVVLPLSRIELDPDNPRKLAIDLNDIRHGVQSDDPLYQQKQVELEKLKELAHTIKSSGVINPVVVYKLGETYRVVAGERRCLASILANKQEVEARVFTEKPKGFDLKLIQWIENTAREDLTLNERLGNVQAILKEYKRQNGDIDLTATLLKNITGLSLSQSTYYLAAINAPEDVQACIQDGRINNLDKAALIAGIESDDMRAEAIMACVEGASVKMIRSLVNQKKMLKRSAAPIQASRRGRAATKINLGSTRHGQVIKKIVDCVLSQNPYDMHASIFAKVDWMDYRQANKAFKKLLELMEAEMVV